MTNYEKVKKILEEANIPIVAQRNGDCDYIVIRGYDDETVLLKFDKKDGIYCAL